jgi:hypothetical protein
MIQRKAEPSIKFPVSALPSAPKKLNKITQDDAFAMICSASLASL